MPSARAEALLLGGLLVVIAVVTFHPHWNPLTGREYEYPVHMDEYVHWGYAMAIVEDGNVNFRNPFTGDNGGEFTVEAHLHERGYHAYLGVFQAVTGIPWIPFFAYGPALVAVFLALTVYVVARPFVPGAGLAAALLVACIPTTLRFLGPGFMVPIAFSLPLVAVGLHAIFHTRSLGGLVAFFLLSAGLWPIHVIGAFGLFALGLLYALFILPTDWKRGTVVLAMVTLPFFASWNFYSKLLDTGVLVISNLPANERVLFLFGAAPLVLAAVGAALLLYRRRGRDFAVGATLGVGLFLSEAVIVYRLYSGLDPFILYDRIFMLLYLQASLLGGVGIAWLAHKGAEAAARTPAPGRVAKRARRGRALGVGVAVALFATSTVAASVAPQLEQPYYEVLSDKDYRAFQEAGLTLNATHGYAVVEGLPTMPFTILAGRPTLYVHFPSGPFEDPAYLRDFFAAGANDTYLLVQNGVTVVVTDRPVSNPDLVPLGEGVYALRQDYAERIARGTASS